MRRCSDHKSTAVVFVESDATSTSCTAGALRVELVSQPNSEGSAWGLVVSRAAERPKLRSIDWTHNATASQSQLEIKF
jgi:hypothetical protein